MNEALRGLVRRFGVVSAPLLCGGTLRPCPSARPVLRRAARAEHRRVGRRRAAVAPGARRRAGGHRGPVRPHAPAGPRGRGSSSRGRILRPPRLRSGPQPPLQPVHLRGAPSATTGRARRGAVRPAGHLGGHRRGRLADRRVGSDTSSAGPRGRVADGRRPQVGRPGPQGGRAHRRGRLGRLGHLAPGHGPGPGRRGRDLRSPTDRGVGPGRRGAGRGQLGGRSRPAPRPRGEPRWLRRSPSSRTRSGGAGPCGRCDPGAPTRAAPGRRLAGVRRPSATPTRPASCASSVDEAPGVAAAARALRPDPLPPGQVAAGGQAARGLPRCSPARPSSTRCWPTATGPWARTRRVDELWDELRQASPSAELVVEGRIVMAGMMADRGDLPGAIRLLEQGWKLPSVPSSTICAVATPWPTSTSGPATWPGPASCSAAWPASLPTSPTSPSASGPWPRTCRTPRVSWPSRPSPEVVIPGRNAVPRSSPVLDDQPADHSITLLIGHLSREPERRVLPSGTTVLALEVSTRPLDGPVESVPVAWFDPPDRLPFGAGDRITVRRPHQTKVLPGHRDDPIADRGGGRAGRPRPPRGPDRQPARPGPRPHGRRRVR